MTRHTTALAQHLAWKLQGARCRDDTTTWAHHEAGYAAATTPTEADAHLIAAQQICSQCPVTEECAQRAHLDRYTGLAAGLAFLNGRPVPHRETP